jgi:hypothetical protein
MFLNSLYALVESQILYKTERSNLVQITCFYLIPIYLLASKAYLTVLVVVEPNGVEPLTSCVQGRRSTN